MDSNRQPFVAQLLAFASAAIGQSEVPPGSNRGPQIDTYLRGFAGRYGDRYLGAPWCGLFAEYQVRATYEALGVPCPIGEHDYLAAASQWLVMGKREGWFFESPGL